MPGDCQSIRLNPKAERRFKGGHPWIYANEIRMDAAAKQLPPGTLARFEDANGGFLAYGYFNPHSLIAGRELSRRPADAPDTASFYQNRFTRALLLRERCFDAPYYRLIHAEADGCPGLIVDRYGDYVIAQINSAGAHLHKDLILTALQNLLQPKGIFLHQDSTARRLEQLPDLPAEVIGTIPDLLELRETGLTFFASPRTGQKTGWFYDQRFNRAFVASLSRGKKILDLYTHTGGFALYALAKGAESAFGVDASSEALALAAKSADAQKMSDKVEWHKADVFDFLPSLQASGQQYDVIIADPPAFIKSRKDIAAGTRGYRKLARLCASCVAPNGLLFFASCSHHISADELSATIAGGLADAGRQGRILKTSFAGPDHPLHPHLPESAYLKALTLVLD